MNMNEANQLARIYNTLLLVNTQGKDTILMGKCLESFQKFLEQINIEEDNNNLKQQEG